MIFKIKTTALGISEDRGRYDLPFNKDEGTDFLTMLVALMTFLAAMALAASFVLGGMAERWSSGLENRLTIEIPAENGDALRNAKDIAALQDKVALVLKNNQNVLSFDVMEKQEIQTLIEPWLGKDALIDTLPLPGLISVQLKSSEPPVLGGLQSDIRKIGDNINVDTHESWLRDLLRLTGTLQFSTFVITIIIGATTIMAVAGGVRSRIAIHRADVELLHLMGASDEYITRQFQRHTLILGLKGGLAGMAGSIVIMAIVRFFSGDTASSLLPNFSLGGLHIAILLAVPLMAALIAGLTARMTVLRSLSRMP
jgi:cell division transport system permease protein